MCCVSLDQCWTHQVFVVCWTSVRYTRYVLCNELDQCSAHHERVSRFGTRGEESLQFVALREALAGHAAVPLHLPPGGGPHHP